MRDLSKQRAAFRRAEAEGLARVDRSIDTEQALADLRRHQDASHEHQLGNPLDPHTCSYCQEFILDVSGPRPSLEGGWLGPKVLNFKHINFVHVKKGVESGCPLCETIFNQLDRNHSSFEDDPDEDLTCFANMYPGRGGEFDVESISPIHVWNANRPSTKWANKLYEKSWHYGCVVEDQDPASDFNTTRPIVTNPASEESFKLMRSWLAECRHGHDQCHHFQTQFRPFRLVEILGTSDDIHIRLSEDSPAFLVEYTTLSYCWGGVQPGQTTTANLERRKSGIDMGQLSATVRDAIRATHRLHISYIWVDSLCIIQDDGDDKAQQIALMPKIYQNSSLTVSTTRALYADEGFLHRRKPTDRPDLVFKLSYVLPSTGELGKVTVFPTLTELLDNALSTRGWALQERALSPRILDFAGGQTRWLCSKTHVDGWRKHDSQQQDHTRNMIQDMLLSKANSIRDTSLTFGQGCSFWENLVTEYTSRALSVATDRSLAIAGLSEVCCGNIGWQEQYMAGMWRSMFPWNLMWSMPTRTWGRLPRPAAYQGPSWSWTSINGSVHYGLCQKLSGGLFTFKTLDCSAELEYQEAPFGAVTSGALVLEGKTLQASWLKSDMTLPVTERDLDHDRIALKDASNELKEAVALRICPDAHEEDWDDPSMEKIDVVLLEVGYEPEQHCDYHGALGYVLRQLADGFYTRLGIFETSRGERARQQEAGEGNSPDLWTQYRDIFGTSELEVVVIV